MARTGHQPLTPKLRRLAERLESYRKRPRRPRRLPEGIWGAAVAQAQEHGVSVVARALRLDYYALKRRASEAASAPRAEVSPNFVEVCVGKSVSDGGWTVELEDGTGRKMRVQMADRGGLDLAGLARAFWGACE